MKPRHVAMLKEDALKTSLKRVRKSGEENIFENWNALKADAVNQCLRISLRKYTHIRDDFVFICKKLSKMVRRASAATSRRYREHIIGTASGLCERLGELVYPMSGHEQGRALDVW
jgi:hypothetical protein